MLFKREGTKAPSWYRHCEKGVSPTRQSRIWIASLTLAMTTTGVIPAKAGIYFAASRHADEWIPAFAGMTMGFKKGSVG